MRRRSLRSRLTLLIATAVALAVAVAAAVCWLLVRGEMRGQIAGSITHLQPPAQQVGFALRDCAGQGRKEGHPRPDWDPSGRSWQVVLADGSVCVASGSAQVTPTARERVMAVSGGRPVLRDAVTTDGTSVLVYTFRYEPRLGGPPGDAAQFPEPPLPQGPVTVSVFRSTAEMDQTLRILALVFGSVSVLGVLGAAVAGLWLARTALRPVERLTRAVEHVARTEDLRVTIPVEGEDEIARLSRSFNTMTAALSSSQERQRRLVADAGHELRTPLTSLRTNIDLLLRSENTGRAIEPSAKRRLLANVKEQFEEMSSLIGDLLELSRKAESGELSSDIDLHEVVASAVERARRRGPGLRFDVDLEPWQVHGDARGLQRAAVNVLDNAVKFSPRGGLVTVRLKGGVLTVRDEGPGIPGDELPHVFERFWRSPSARSLPGSGLGLSIVAQAVRDAGGRVAIENAPGGGTLATVELPGGPPTA
ncbi:cell wall metabolism sensor histidine kinase WalK [Microbispora sp. H10830]|uniref:sensor histidine kinase n=1 Tax=Microbispora sp. H10830 TaxID=2729109 RepID=UPI0016023FAA|nr:HAMP domain-containing sensor histidine kinase [Microbispora sp. H10830]